MWKSSDVYMSVSWAMAKNSHLTPFLAHAVRKFVERGIVNNYHRRHIIAAPNCKPVRNEGQPLGMEKLAPLFLLYLACLVMSGIILIIENIFKPSRTFYLQENITKLEILKQELEDLTIDYEEIENESEEIGQRSVEISFIIPTFDSPSKMY